MDGSTFHDPPEKSGVFFMIEPDEPGGSRNDLMISDVSGEGASLKPRSDHFEMAISCEVELDF